MAHDCDSHVGAQTWNVEAECGHISGATFDGTHHGWWVERAKAVQLLNYLDKHIDDTGSMNGKLVPRESAPRWGLGNQMI